MGKTVYEWQHTAATLDICRSVKWLRTNAKERNVDGSEIGSKLGKEAFGSLRLSDMIIPSSPKQSNAVADGRHHDVVGTFLAGPNEPY